MYNKSNSMAILNPNKSKGTKGILVFCPECEHLFVDVLRDYLFFKKNKRKATKYRQDITQCFICPFCKNYIYLW